MCSSRWNKPLELKGQYIPGTRCLLSTHSWHTVPAQCIFLVHSAQSVYIPGTWCPLCAHSWHAVPALCIFLVHRARSVHIPGTQFLLGAHSWHTVPALCIFLARGAHLCVALLPIWKLTHDLETSWGLLCFSKIFLKKEQVQRLWFIYPRFFLKYIFSLKKSYFKNQWFSHSKNTFKL